MMRIPKTATDESQRFMTSPGAPRAHKRDSAQNPTVQTIMMITQERETK
jgi:hypothetical protein